MAASEAAPAEAKSGDEGGEADMGEDMGAGASAYDQDHMAGLTDAQLIEVFKQTSIFNVRSALANNDALMSTTEAGDNDERCATCQIDEYSTWPHADHESQMHQPTATSCLRKLRYPTCALGNTSL